MRLVDEKVGPNFLSDITPKTKAPLYRRSKTDPLPLLGPDYKQNPALKQNTYWGFCPREVVVGGFRSTSVEEGGRVRPRGVVSGGCYVRRPVGDASDALWSVGRFPSGSLLLDLLPWWRHLHHLVSNRCHAASHGYMRADRCPIVGSPQKSVPPGGAGRDWFLPVNCRPGILFWWRPCNRETFIGSAIF